MCPMMSWSTKCDLALGDAVGGARRQPQRPEDALDQRGLEARVGGRLLERVRRLRRREELLQVAERQPAAVARHADLLERVAALAHPRHQARVGDGVGRPLAVVLRDQAAALPAAQRRGRRTDLACDVRG